MIQGDVTTLVDANVLIDVALQDAEWGCWSRAALASAREKGAVAINALVYAEMAPAFATASDLDNAFPADEIARLPIPFEAGWLAGQAFMRYRRAGGSRRSPLPDLYIGAHAQVSGMRLLTRDTGRYRTYFPEVSLIAPG